MPRKKDYAERKTDEMISDLEKKISREYETAYKEVSKKLDDFLEGSAQREAEKRQLVEAGKMTEKEFLNWKAGQTFISDRWRNMRDELAEDLVKADLKALSMTKGFLPEAYALNHNYGTYEIEKGTSINTAYTLYSRETVERLLKDEPKLLPDRKLDIPKDKIWNRQHINSAVVQGVLQGDDLKSISKRLRNVTDMDRRGALRNARTMMTGAQNAGRLDAYKRAQSLGIEVQKEWMATLDKHTRDSHARLDGEKVALDAKFSNGLEYPGDPKGDPSEVYNCRCTMVADTPEYPDTDMMRYDNIAGKPIKNVTYAEWAKEHGRDIYAKKEYDFEQKSALYKVSEKELKEAQRAFSDAKYKMESGRNREDYIEELRERYKDVADFTEEDIAKLEEKIQSFDEKTKELEKADNKWWDRPSRNDKVAFEEWKRWKEEWEEKHGASPSELLTKLYDEKYSNVEKINDFKVFKRRLEEANRLTPKGDLVKVFEEAKRNLEKAQKNFDTKFTAIDKLILSAYEKNVPYKEVSLLRSKLSGVDIIRKLAGGDMTEGSCHSLALCYAANKAGIDVIDYRGGKSQDFFADYDVDRLLLKAGMKGRTETGYNQQKSALKLLREMETDKEYILSGGRHAAVVKKITNEFGTEELMYLEMQSPHINGWVTFGYGDNEAETAKGLKWRFGMTQSKTWDGQKCKTDVFLLDVDSAKDVENFDVLMGFVNTDPDKQQKGKLGIIR